MTVKNIKNICSCFYPLINSELIKDINRCCFILEKEKDWVIYICDIYAYNNDIHRNILWSFRNKHSFLSSLPFCKININAPLTEEEFLAFYVFLVKDFILHYSKYLNYTQEEIIKTKYIQPVVFFNLYICADVRKCIESNPRRMVKNYIIVPYLGAIDYSVFSNN